MVAYLARGISIENVWIWECKEHPGEWEGGLWPNKTNIEPRLRLFVTLVAPTADEKRFGTGFRKGDKEDLDMARKIAEIICSPEKVDSIVAKMLKEAQCFIDDPNNWAAIERIANRLMAKVNAIIQEEEPLFGRKVQAREEELQEWFDEKGVGI